MTTKTQVSEKIIQNEKLNVVKLEILSGPMDGLEFEITKDKVTIGREPYLDISIPLDIKISRSHARVIHENGEYWLEDFGSINGTFIGDKRVVGKVNLPLEKIFMVGASEMKLTAE